MREVVAGRDGERRRVVFRTTTVVALASVSVLAFAGACLPDLADIQPFETEAGTSALAFCGDGIIQTVENGVDAGESCDPGGGEAGIGVAPSAGCTQDCKLACPGKLDDATGHCYFFVEPPTSLDRAQNVCNAVGAHVVTIGSTNELEVVEDYAAGASYWVGLKKSQNYDTVGVDEPGFPGDTRPCPGCFGITDEAGVFPIDDGGGDHPCVVSRRGKWVRVSCEEDPLRATLCERAPEGQRAQPCAGPFCTTLRATATSKRYVISLEPATALAAATACKSYTGGTLATFGSAEEREQLAIELTTLVPPPVTGTRRRAGALTFWVGASLGDGGAWSWDDGQDASIPWGGGQPAAPDAGRAFISILEDAFDTQLLATDRTAETRGFVCQRPFR